MLILPFSSATAPAGTSGTSGRAGLRPGQVVQAVVAVAAASRVTLLISGHERLEAQTDLPLRVGDRVQLEVVDAGGQLGLRLLTPESAAAAGRRPSLIQPSPLGAEQLATLARALSPAAALRSLLADAESLAPGDRELLTRLAATLPSLAALTQSGNMETAVAQSGPFLEARLAHGVSPEVLADDQKALLLRLAASDTLPAVLRGQVGGWLARITQNQIATLDSAAPVTAWYLDMVLHHDDQADSVAMRYTRRQADEDRNPYWSARLDFDLPGLGHVQADVVLEGTEIVHVYFDSTGMSAAREIGNALPLLERAFSAAGLKSGHLHSRQTDLAPPRPPGYDGGILDTRA